MSQAETGLQMAVLNGFIIKFTICTGFFFGIFCYRFLKYFVIFQAPAAGQLGRIPAGLLTATPAAH